MNEAMMDAAYTAARVNYKAAEVATFRALGDRFASAGFDVVHRAAERGMRLHISAMDLAQKVWARTLSHEKAGEVLAQQYSEFPAATRQKALNDASTATR